MLTWMLAIMAAMLALAAGYFVWSRRSAKVERGREERRAERQPRRVAEWEEVEKGFGGRHPDMRMTMDRDSPAAGGAAGGGGAPGGSTIKQSE